VFDTGLDDTWKVILGTEGEMVEDDEKIGNTTEYL
jgi:hypothetical protein